MLDWLFSDPLPVGGEAPDFRLLDESGMPATLAEHRGHRNVILIFYPADDTRICTQQVCEMRDSWSELSARNTAVYGINPGGEESHRHFREKHRLPFPILVDEGKRVAKLYHADGLIVKRTVYLIGRDGKIVFAERGKPTPAEVLRHIPN